MSFKTRTNFLRLLRKLTRDLCYASKQRRSASIAAARVVSTDGRLTDKAKETCHVS